MKSRALRARLTAWYASILAAAFLAAGVGAWWTVRDSINDSLARDPSARLDEFYEALDDLRWTALVASPLLLLATAAGGWWLSGRALKPVEDSFRRMTQFTADASHELRTPVAVIRATAEVALAKARTAEEYAQALERVLLESQRATRLIEDLMLLARADAGADDLALEPVDLADVVRRACGEAHPLAEAAGITLAAGAFPACPIRGDEHALRRLLVILLDNAVKYTPPGGTITVSLRLESGGIAVLEVRDTGIGIAAEDLPRIFERFYRVARDRSRSTGGAGLGLAIARWIAVRHGGDITAASTQGAGAVFSVRIPAHFS